MIAIDTNLLIYAHRSGTSEHRSARRAIEKAIGSSGGCAGVLLLGPGPSFAIRLLQIAADLDVTGPRICDLQIALCALDGGAGRVWTNDRRFVKLPGLAIENPS